jgi:arylsulfatase A-like enzyme
VSQALKRREVLDSVGGSGPMLIARLVAAASVATLVAACRRDPPPRAVVRRAAVQQETKAPPAAAPAPVIPQPPEHPNILLITLDTIRYNQTGLADQATNQTPFLQSLAASGVEFTSSYSTYDSTPESHFSMLTGYVYGLGSQFDTPEHSLPHQLRRLGYDTFGIVANGNLSKKHNRDVERFQRYVCFYDVWEAMSPAQKETSSRTIDRLLRHYGAPANDFNRAMLYTSDARVIGRFDKEISRTRQPFFGFVNLLDSHDPYLPDPASYDADAEEKGLRPPHFQSDLRTRPMAPELEDPSLIKDEKRRTMVKSALDKAEHRTWQLTFDLDADSLAVYRKRYRARIRETDAAVRRIFAILAERKLLESTVVIVTSDHGESLGEEHLITHSFINRGDREVTHRVPLILSFPAAYGFRGHSIPLPTTSADIAPTIYDLVGVDWSGLSKVMQPGLYGKSLYPYLAGTLAMHYRNRPAAPQRLATDAERARTRTEAEKRLRSLGYLH